MTLLMRKPKKKPKRKQQSSRVEQVLSAPDSEAEEIALEDDPNYKVDENGCEWWYDEGKWWYRTPEMDDWDEYSG